MGGLLADPQIHEYTLDKRVNPSAQSTKVGTRTIKILRKFAHLSCPGYRALLLRIRKIKKHYELRHHRNR